MAASAAIITDLFKFARIIALILMVINCNQSLNVRDEALDYA